MTNLKCVQIHSSPILDNLNKFISDKKIYSITPEMKNEIYGQYIGSFIVIYFDEPKSGDK